jgi:hypothetical protein
MDEDTRKRLTNMLWTIRDSSYGLIFKNNSDGYGMRY